MLHPPSLNFWYLSLLSSPSIKRDLIQEPEPCGCNYHDQEIWNSFQRSSLSSAHSFSNCSYSPLSLSIQHLEHSAHSLQRQNERLLSFSMHQLVFQLNFDETSSNSSINFVETYFPLIFGIFQERQPLFLQSQHLLLLVLRSLVSDSRFLPILLISIGTGPSFEVILKPFW